MFLSEAPIYLNSDANKKLQVPHWLISATPLEFNRLLGAAVRTKLGEVDVTA